MRKAHPEANTASKHRVREVALKWVFRVHAAHVHVQAQVIENTLSLEENIHYIHVIMML
jgi:hypothetical protein